MAKTLTTDEWVRRLNRLAWEMGELEDMMHPSAWPSSELPGLMERFQELAERPCAPDVKQLELFPEAGEQ